MEKLQGRKIVGGKASGRALVTRMPINFTASFTKPMNLIPSKRGVIMDHQHELFKQDVKGKILVFPACIGSTYTGIMLLQLIGDNAAPAGVIVRDADSLLASGPILGRAWFNRSFPIVEYPDDAIFDKVKSGAAVEVDGDSGEIILG